MLSLEEGIAIDGIFKTRKRSRSKEMVFGHSILRVFTGRIFSSCHSEILMGLNWFTEPCHWKGREMSRLRVSSHAFGGQANTDFRTSRFECVSSMKNNSLHKSFQAPKIFPALPRVSLHTECRAYLALILWKMTVGMRRSALPIATGKPPHLLYYSKGRGCSCQGNNVSDTITPQSTNTLTMVGRREESWGICPEASRGDNASSTLCRR